MKIEIEIPDLEEIYYSCEDCAITGKGLKEAMVDIAIEKFIDKDDCVVCECEDTVGDEPMIYPPFHFCSYGERK